MFHRGVSIQFRVLAEPEKSAEVKCSAALFWDALAMTQFDTSVNAFDVQPATPYVSRVS